MLTIVSMLLAQASEAAASPTVEYRTTLRIELLLPASGRGQIAAQNWVRFFGDLGYRCSTKRPVLQRETGVTESVRGRLRTVVAVFEMDNDGSLTVGTRRFPRGGSELLRDWLAELEAFGAGGRSDGQPRFGLAEDDFANLASRAAGPVHAADTVANLAAVLADRLEYPVRVGSRLSLDQRLPGPPPVAMGTAAAWQLEAIDAAWSIGRVAGGSEEIRIDVRDDARDSWPIGWESPSDLLPGRLAPALFRPIDYPADPVSLPSFLAAVSTATDVPIVGCRGALAVDPGWREVVVEWQPATRRPYSSVKRKLIAARLARSLRLDDAGRPFLMFFPRDREELAASPAVRPAAVEATIARVRKASGVPAGASPVIGRPSR